MITASNKTKTIIIIDDEQICLQGAAIMFIDTQYKVLLFGNAEDGLAHVMQHKNSIDLILSDIDMPHMTGLELVAKIKANPDLKHIPIILQTGANYNTIKEGMALGANGYVQKPYTKVQLFEVLNKILYKKLDV